MKVVTPKVMTELEAKAYQQGFVERDFMENAGKGISERVQNFFQTSAEPKKVQLLCGKGNNAGDAFVAGCDLLAHGYEVSAIQLEDLEHCSPLCRQNGKRFLENGGKIVRDPNAIATSGILLDGIFGTGFKGKVGLPYSTLIEAANQSGLSILSIDIPSGLNGATGQVEGCCIYAMETFFLGLPKVGFFLEEGWNVAGRLKKVDFGLPPSIQNEASAYFEMKTTNEIAGLLPPIKRNRHKYEAGFVIGLAGSLTMPGAGLLSSLAAFRAGSGVVRLLYPQGLESQLSSAPYELIKIPYQEGELPESILAKMHKANAIYLGPGLGRSDRVKTLLNSILPLIKIPCIIDADALTLYAEQQFQLPPRTIFTPHMGEMQTLLKSDYKPVLNAELLNYCQKYAEDHQITLILKGAPTFIFHPQMPAVVNTTGDPGMATAGSGDVLTGLLASLLSQGLSCRDAAILGVHLHGLAGEMAAQERGTSYGVMATDIISHFPTAYVVLLRAGMQE